jgi:DNA primase
VLCFDGDEAGIKAMRRSAKMLSAQNVIPEAVVLPNNLDPDEYIKEYGASQLETYLISKAKPVYYWLYQLAYQKVIKNDIASIENFKHTVFEFLSEINQETIKEHYLNQISQDLGIDINSLRKDFANYQPSYSNNETITEVTVQPEPVVVQPILKEVPVTKAIRRAYRIIIKHAIYDHNNLNRYLAMTQEFYPGAQLLLEFSIIQALELEILMNPKILNTTKFAKHNIDALMNDDAFKDYVTDIINDQLIDVTNNDDFEQSIEKVNQYIKKVKTRNIKNRVISGDENAINEFTKSKQDENNL